MDRVGGRVLSNERLPPERNPPVFAPRFGSDSVRATERNCRCSGDASSALRWRRDAGRAVDGRIWDAKSCYCAPVTLSVLILALNEEDQVAGAVFSASAPGVEVVVVDGGSTDATRECAAAAGARVVDLAGGEAGRAR